MLLIFPLDAHSLTIEFPSIPWTSARAIEKKCGKAALSKLVASKAHGGAIGKNFIDLYLPMKYGHVP